MRSERVVKVLEGKMTRRDIEQMMAVADTSKDGRIDYQGLFLSPTEHRHLVLFSLLLSPL